MLVVEVSLSDMTSSTSGITEVPHLRHLREVQQGSRSKIRKLHSSSNTIAVSRRILHLVSLQYANTINFFSIFMHTYVHNTLLGIILGFSIGLGMYIIAPFTSAAGGGIYYTLFPKILSSAGTVKDSSELLGVGAA